MAPLVPASLVSPSFLPISPEGAGRRPLLSLPSETHMGHLGGLPGGGIRRGHAVLVLERRQLGRRMKATWGRVWPPADDGVGITNPGRRPCPAHPIPACPSRVQGALTHRIPYTALLAQPQMLSLTAYRPMSKVTLGLRGTRGRGGDCQGQPAAGRASHPPACHRGAELLWRPSLETVLSPDQPWGCIRHPEPQAPCLCHGRHGQEGPSPPGHPRAVRATATAW